VRQFLLIANQKFLHAEEFCYTFSDSTPSNRWTCYRAFVSLAATASNGTKLFRRRTKERERKINLVTGPTLCKPYASIHHKNLRLIHPGLPTNSEYTTCQWEKKMGILRWFLPCICVSSNTGTYLYILLRGARESREILSRLSDIASLSTSSIVCSAIGQEQYKRQMLRIKPDTRNVAFSEKPISFT